jgi:hypothetical protein
MHEHCLSNGITRPKIFLVRGLFLLANSCSDSARADILGIKAKRVSSEKNLAKQSSYRERMSS